MPPSSTTPCGPAKFPVVIGVSGEDIRINQIEVDDNDNIVAAGYVTDKANGDKIYPMIYSSKYDVAWKYESPFEQFIGVGFVVDSSK